MPAKIEAIKNYGPAIIQGNSVFVSSPLMVKLESTASLLSEADRRTS